MVLNSWKNQIRHKTVKALNSEGQGHAGIGVNPFFILLSLIEGGDKDE
jgi:hypothetical protein